MFLLVSVCCDTYSRVLVFLLVSVCCDTYSRVLVFLLCQCVVIRTAQAKAENSEVKGFYKADVNGYWPFVVYVAFFKLLPVFVVRHKE